MKTIVELFKAILITFSALVFLYIFNPATCFSDELFVSYGLGLFKSAENTISETKVADVGYRFDLYSPWKLQVKAGGWFDGSNNPLRSSSFYVAAGPQYVITAGSLEVRNGIGVSYITHTDSYLGGHFQFNPEFYLGVRDKEGSGIGIKYSHHSSGWISQPNIGRDSASLELSGKF